MQTSKEAFDEEAWAGIHALVLEAADNFDAFRNTEGASLEADFKGRLNEIERLESGLDPLLEARIQRVRDRIRTNLEETIDRASLDEGRFEQEVLYYIEKMDVSEERTRLQPTLRTSVKSWKPVPAKARSWDLWPRKWAVRSTRSAARPTMPNFNALSSR